MPKKEKIKADLFLYNSLSKKKELFKPIKSNLVGMYCCGPTVYSEPHIGNMRSFITFDIIVRTFKYLGYKVRYVRNITDIGHLTENEEDKVEKKALLEKIEPMEIAQRYSNSLRDVSGKFNLIPPSIEPIASGHLIEQIDMIKQIISKGMAYEKNGSVYFNTKLYSESNNYGELSSKNLNDLLENVRDDLEKSNEKKFFADFSLWKKAAEKTITKWDSPWGQGVPGWHLECSAMSRKYLGNRFDIHGGGMDLKFPHHECEIAQSITANNTSPANYWVHGNMLTVNGSKMSKSLGNHINTKDLISGNSPLLSKGYNPMVIKFFFLQTNYKSTIDLSDLALKQSEKGYKKLIGALNLIDTIIPSEKSSITINDFIEEVHHHLFNDFDTPQLLASLFNWIKILGTLTLKKESINKNDLIKIKNLYHTILIDVLGFKKDDTQLNLNNKTVNLIDFLIELRENARNSKNFELSDTIRDRMNALNISMEDTKDGIKWEIK